MLSLWKFPAQLQHTNLLLLHNSIQNHHFTSKHHFSFSAKRLIPLNFHTTLGKKSTVFCSNALKAKEKGDSDLSEIEDFENLEDDFTDVEDDDEFDEDDELIVPLENMKKWLANRPTGFGEGKVYDTSVEDKLMEEIEKSREAQIVNVNKLKNNPVNPNSKKEPNLQDKASTPIIDGFRVRLVNLPKKKNIHRDLQPVFKGVPGIINIVPAVSGNQKTRDPICKGIAFVDFKYKDDAQRFVENFSGQSISFGKVQKEIKCEMTNSLPKPAPNRPVDKANLMPKEPVLSIKKDSKLSVNTNISSLNKLKESSSSKHEKKKEAKVASDSNFIDVEINPSSSKPERKVKTVDKKFSSKPKKNNVPKLKIPGSANRLKIREKAMLTDVFSKYGANAGSTVIMEQSR